MESLITTERLGAVMRIRIDREAKKNALTIAMYDRMADAVEQAADNSEIRAILLTGGSKIFTAGNDLNDFLDPKRDGKGVQRFLSALPAIDKPVVAAVNGHAIGIGTTMLLHCDLVYVGRSASLRMPFVELGL
ncbi:MAG: enoyl-CoA hydratase-related protein, partial [Myxococcales bacterium]|nr:enoyl-CoA hydratase-related protein [Myxococcales bacterium]